MPPPTLRRWITRVFALALILGEAIAPSYASADVAAGGKAPNASCTAVGGSISASTTWLRSASPYCVTSTVDVISGATLTIQPGVTVEFSSAQALQIDGTLIARGTSSSPITFTSSSSTPAPGDWDYIFFSPTAASATYNAKGQYTGGSIIQHAVVEYGGAALAGGSSGDGGIQVVTSSPYIDHDTIQSNQGDGIDFTGSTSPRLTNDKILNNGVAGTTNGEGIYVVGGAGTADFSANSISSNAATGILVFGISASIVGNTITSNGSCGISADMSGTNVSATISGNTVTSNYTGICGADGSHTISNNVVSGNRYGGIEVQLASATISSNLITGNSTSGGGIGVEFIAFYPETADFNGNTINGNINGGGVYVQAGNSLSTVSITNNTISGNSAGIGGGGVYLDGLMTISGFSGNVIANNSAPAANGGGSIYLTDSLCSSASCPTTAINNNDIYGGNAGTGTSLAPNDVYNGNLAGTTLDFTNNWWNTTDPSTIDSHIWDYFDDPSLSTVNYQPFLTASIPLPDYVETAVSNPPASAKPGSSFSVTDTTANNGPGTGSASSVTYYLSRTIIKGSGALALTGTRLAPSLAPAATSGGTTRVTVPTSIRAGSYYLLACANDNGLVSETDGGNNCLASATQVSVS